MPIEQITELLKDKPELIQEVKDIFDRASALDTVKKANSDLTTERETWKTEKKDLQAKIAAKKEDGTGNAELNSLKEQLAALTEAHKASEEKAKKATQDKLSTDLRNDIVTAAAPEAINASQVFALMQAEGLTGYGEDGKAFYHRVNDKGEPVKAKSPAEAVQAYLKSNPHLAKSSGNEGSGKKPDKTGATTGLLENPMALLK